MSICFLQAAVRQRIPNLKDKRPAPGDLQVNPSGRQVPCSPLQVARLSGNGCTAPQPERQALSERLPRAPRGCPRRSRTASLNRDYTAPQAGSAASPPVLAGRPHHDLGGGFAELSQTGKILEKTGLCSQITFGRYVRQGRKLGVDPKLFIQDLQFNKVPVRVYQPKATSDGRRRGIIFFHGGGWVFGSLDTYEKVCRYISRESESVVVSVQYRLAPEHKYPAAYEDCLNATIHFMKNIELYGVDPANVIVCGDSAGGNLAAAVSQTLAGRSDLPKLRAQILIYPGLQALDFNLPSYQQNRGVPLLFRERAAFFALQYLNGDALHMQEVLEGSHIPPDMRLKYRKWVSPDNIPEKFKVRGVKPLRPTDFIAEVYETVKRFCEPNLCPLLAEDAIVHQLPESFILTCEYDVLRDDGLLYKKRLEDNGVRVTWYHLEDGFHGIISLYDYCGFSFPAGKRGLDSVVNFLKSL
ncbi:PREDICTED: arylacetamide deacetylase-like 4 [Haliaeetus leucocephalus]|uniref:arylacetamide deacetylase-like 4 n=1 Tax=Haliaeetus leucocephalus TaxID=52644 RepID=UPI00053CE7F5|nr:PREDICTED: arylacetamide deacetylase-like 4 [Haliaeetus leucocephalus]